MLHWPVAAAVGRPAETALMTTIAPVPVPVARERIVVCRPGQLMAIALSASPLQAKRQSLFMLGPFSLIIIYTSVYLPYGMSSSTF